MSPEALEFIRELAREEIAKAFRSADEVGLFGAAYQLESPGRVEASRLSALETRIEEATQQLRTVSPDERDCEVLRAKLHAALEALKP